MKLACALVSELVDFEAPLRNGLKSEQRLPSRIATRDSYLWAFATRGNAGIAWLCELGNCELRGEEGEGRNECTTVVRKTNESVQVD